MLITGAKRCRAAELESFDRVHRAEHLSQRAAIGIEAEVHIVAFALQAMAAHTEAVPIHLEAVTQAGLHHAFALLDLQQ